MALVYCNRVIKRTKFLRLDRMRLGDGPYDEKRQGHALQAHSGLDMLWPLGLIMRVLTSRSESEVARYLTMFKQTHAGNGFMHEYFSKDDARKYRRITYRVPGTQSGSLRSCRMAKPEHLNRRKRRKRGVRPEKGV